MLIVNLISLLINLLVCMDYFMTSNDYLMLFLLFSYCKICVGNFLIKNYKNMNFIQYNYY